MKLRFSILILLAASVVMMVGCEKKTDGNGGLQDMKFGKSITILVAEDEIVDATYLQKVLDGEINKEVPYFDLWDKDELTKMIAYMEEGNYMISPGTYIFNQAWRFEDGMFVQNNGEKREVFKFKVRN